MYGSSAFTASTAVIGSAVFDPWMTTWPPLLSTAAITCSGPTASASVFAKATHAAVAEECRAGDQRRVRQHRARLARARLSGSRR